MANETQQAQFSEIGSTGLPVYGGRVYDEPLRKLTADAWRRAVRDMTANDPVVNSSLAAIEMLSRQVTWNVEPATSETACVEQADFVRDCLFKDMTQTWQDTLSEILSFLPWGWSYLELCYKRRSGESRDKTKDSRFSDGKIGLRKIAIRAQETLDEWKLDDFGEVEAMVQLAPPDYRSCTIPFEKALHFRTASNKQNPEGRSILRGMYRAWYFKSNIENIEGIGVERDLAGFPVAFLPPEVLTSSAPNDVKLRQALVDLVTKIKRNEKEGALFPRAFDKNGNLIYDLQLLSSGGQRQFDTSKIIDRWDQRMLMSIMADFLLLGSKATGSFALSTDKTELFSSALGAWLDTICEQFNRYCFPRLVRLNGGEAKNAPRLVHGPVEKISLKELGDFVQRLSGAKVGFTPEQGDWLKRQINMPITEREKK